MEHYELHTIEIEDVSDEMEPCTHQLIFTLTASGIRIGEIIEVNIRDLFV